MPNIEAQENEPLHVVINRLDKCVHRQLGDLAELCEEPGDLVEVEGVLRRLRHLYRMVELKKLKKLNHTERAEILWKEILHTQGKPHHVGLAYYNQDTKWYDVLYGRFDGTVANVKIDNASMSVHTKVLLDSVIAACA